MHKLSDPAEIIQKRNSVEEGSKEYYVHYKGCKLNSDNIIGYPYVSLVEKRYFVFEEELTCQTAF